MDSQKGRGNRWYERDDTLNRAVGVMILLPQEICDIVAEGVIALANREFEVEEMMKSVRSLGDEKIMGFLKSKNKRRTYDESPILHKTMNYLYILSPENQLAMADHVLELVSHIKAYLADCKKVNRDASLEEVSKIVALYVAEGSTEVRQFLATLRDRFREKLNVDAEPVDFLTEANVEQSRVTLKTANKPE